jgi:hypothetical protein
MNSWFNMCSALTVALAVRLVEQRFGAAFERPSSVSSPSEAALFAANDPAKSRNSDFLITFDQYSDVRSLILTMESALRTGDETRVV